MQKALVLVLLSAVVLFSAVSGVHICDRCLCLPTRANAESINCTCQGNIQDVLTFSPGDMTAPALVQSIHVSDCQGVNLLRHSFVLAARLNDIAINRVAKVHIDTGVFQSLASLTVDSAALSLSNNAFMGCRDVKSFIFKNVTMAEVPKHAFYDVTGIEKFIMKNVTVGSIRTEAFQMTMDKQSEFTLENSVVQAVEKGAIVLDTSKIRIINSHLESVSEGAFNVSAAGVEIQESHFGEELESQAFAIQASFVNISDNLFQNLPSMALKAIHLNYPSTSGGPQKFIFKDNHIQQLSRDSMVIGSFRDLSSLDISDNLITCNCSEGQKQLVSSAFPDTPLMRQYHQQLLQDNHCSADCIVSLHEFGLFILQDLVCRPEAEDHAIQKLCMLGQGRDMVSEMVPTVMEGRMVDRPQAAGRSSEGESNANTGGEGGHSSGGESNVNSGPDSSTRIFHVVVLFLLAFLVLRH